MKSNLKSAATTLCCAFGLSLALVPALAGDDKDPAALQSEIDALEAKKDSLQKQVDRRDEKTNAEIERLETEIDAHQDKLDEAETAREEEIEDKDAHYKGNANHTRDMIKVESEALRERVRQASNEVDKSEKTCTAAGYDTLKETESFTYEQKVAHVDKFKKEAALTLVSLDRAVQDMIFTYDDARKARAGKRSGAETTATEVKLKATVDKSVTEGEEETYEGNANHARDLIKEHADAVRNLLDETVAALKKSENEDIDATYAKLEDDGKFPYKAKREYLNTFKEHAADSFMSLHTKALDALPHFRQESMKASMPDKAKGLTKREDPATE